MVNLNNLQNITPLNVNYSSINNSSTILTNAIDSLNTVFPYWLLTSMIALYIILLYYILKKQDLVPLDFLQSSLVSSFIVILVSFAAVRVGLSNNIVPLTFFGVIWIISAIALYYSKRNG